MMLQAHNLEVRTGGKMLFASLNLEFHPGTLTTIVGENGVGKSSLLDHLTGLRPPSTGSVTLGAQTLASLSTIERAKCIAALGQEERHARDLPIESRIAQGLIPRRGWQALLDAATLKRVHTISDELDLAHLRGRSLATLSGGEKKRVHIARALIDHDAQVYTLDEPDAGLDIRHKQTLMQVLKRRRDAGKIVLITLHDLSLASRFGDNTLVLAHRQVVAHEPSPRALTPEVMERAFGVSCLV
jgi:iron complex transport system ATP-binding protein